MNEEEGEDTGVGQKKKGSRTGQTKGALTEGLRSGARDPHRHRV